MRTAAAETSIAAYYGRVIPHLAQSQNERVMAVIKPGKDYSLCELMALTNTPAAEKAGPHPIDKSSMSRVVNGLRAANRLEAVEDGKRKCSVTGVTIIPSRLKSKQLVLL